MGNIFHRSSRITDPVAAWKQQNREFPVHPLYTLVNFNNGGKLLDAYNKGGRDKLIQALKEHVEPLLYNRGKGGIISKTEYLRWRYQTRLRLLDTNKAMPLKTDEELLSEYREDKYQKFTEHEACWSLNARGPMGETALHICFLLNTPVHIQIAHIMIEIYPKLVLDVYEGTEYFGESCLHIAVVNGNLKSVRFLISKNINVNQRATGIFFLPADQVGWRKKETDFKGLAHYGEYPLAFAACHEHYEIYDYLMNYGANPNFQDSFGNTVLHLVVITNRVDFYKYAVKHMTIPGDTTITNIYDLTPLALACKLGRPEIFHVMLELSAIELWRYSNITCSVYPIANLDTVDPDGVTSWTTALNLILDGETDEHLDMMEGKVIKQLLDEKWKTFAQRGFFKLLVFAFLHLVLLSIAVYTRPISGFLQYRGAIDAVRFICEIIVCILCVLVLSLSAKDLYQLGIKGFLKNSSHAPSKTIFVMCCLLTLLCIPLRFAKLEGAEDFLMIIAVPGSWCVLLFFARGMVLTGPFVTMVYKMIIGDVFRFVIIYLIMVGAFAQAFFFLFRDIDDSSITTFRDLVATIINLFQMTLGEFSYDHMNQAHYSTLTKLLFIVFMILIPILLLNMLIAMMGNTYQSVINKAEIEWKKQWAKTISVLERSYSEKELREFQEEFSIPITKSGESGESSRPPRGLMVIKVSNKTRATQRKGALSNWKYYGKEIIKQVKEHLKKNTKEPMVIQEMKKKMYIKDMDGKFVLASEKIPSFIRDDLDFLNHLPNKTSKDFFLVSFDVINLYTSIPHEYGLIAIQYWLEKFPHDIPDRIGKEFIIEEIKFILQNNFFNFNENTYRQKSGTAMGTRVAPTFANLVMAYLEVQIYEHTRLKFGDNFQKYLLTN
ncbi:transient receptor potential cation channel subfamily V member 5 [Octopus bimaculoides]|uniref:transient receptor potential cation channel subfamily V member 5 n=1 Tax=Octopus bimaculoides TaxID=37653 RepID=UPI0022E243C1|nr:transient receptor potential cation channel subfamily V member 5 [Octopus bimaculoides]